MMRKPLLHLIIFILVALPIFGALGEQASAATSRVAIIKEMKGTVKVKKAGGSKEFTAFAKMSLNEGDILAVGAGGSAVLQFANGTSEDDKMTVSGNSTLTFSKLSNKKGTTTKVSMFNGSAWVDVKSIENKDDEFTLETPTAIMGVRGTHLLVNVDPLTGATHLTVAAGVVNAQTTDPTDPDTRNVYPTENALVTDDRQGNPEITIAPVDLELLMRQNDSNIAQAIVSAAGEIIKENNAKMNEYLDQIGTGNPADKERLKSNVENILGAIVSQALDSKLITQERLNQILSEVRTQSGVDVDLTKNQLQLSEEEKQRQKDQRLKDEEAQQRAKELIQQEERDRQKELADKLDEERKQREEEKRKVLADKNKKALDEYERLLTVQEKERFNDDKSKLNPQTSVPTQTGSGAGSQSSSTNSSSPTPDGNTNLANALLRTLKLEKEASGGIWEEVSYGFTSNNKSYSIVLPNDNTLLRISANPVESAASIASVQMGGIDLAGTDGIYSFYYTGNNTLTVNVLAPNGVSKEKYTLNVNRPLNMEGVSTWTNDGNIAWFDVGDNMYAGHSQTSLSEFGMKFGFDSPLHVSYAEIKYLDNTHTERTVRTNALGEIRLTGLPTATYVLFTLQLYDSSNAPVREEKMLWLMNGLEQPVFNVNQPFKLYDGSGSASPAPIIYSEGTEEDHYYATAEHRYNSVRIMIPYEGSPVSIVPIFVYNHQSQELIEPVIVPGVSSYLPLDLQMGDNDFTVFVTDRSGLFIYSYELSIFRKTVPDPLTSWNLTSGTDTHTWNKVTGLSWINRYYVDVDEARDSAMFNMTWNPGSLLSYYLYDMNGDLIANGDGSAGTVAKSLSLEPGNNLYKIELVDSNDNSVMYELVVVRGSIPAITLGNIEIKQSTPTGPSVILAVYGTGTNSYSVLTDNAIYDDLKLKLIDQDELELKVKTQWEGSEGYIFPIDGNFYLNDLNPGENNLEIMVDDLTHREQEIFTVTIFLVNDPKYSNANLESLVFEKQIYTGAEWVYESQSFGFNAAQEEYSIELGANYSGTRISAVPASHGATVKVKEDDGDFGDMSSLFYVNSGPVYTEVYVQVTAMNGETTKTYKLNLRRPIPAGLSLWTARNISDQLVKWTLSGTKSGGIGLYKANTTTSALVDMQFKFTSGSPETDYVVVKQLSGVTNFDNVVSGTLTGDEWSSDSTGLLQLTGMTLGYNYYSLQVFSDSSGSPVQIGPIHYLELKGN